MICRSATNAKRRCSWSTIAIGLLTTITCQADPFVPGYERFVNSTAWQPHQRGDILLTELSCTACHPTPEPRWQPKRGPRLNAVARRLRASWLEQFLRSPQRVKPGTTMPRVMSDRSEPEQTRIVNELLAFLSTQRDDFPQLKADGAHPLPHEFWLQGDPKAGRTLYHQIGCVACHEPEAITEDTPDERSTLEEIAAQLDSKELAELGFQDAVRPVQSVPLGDLNDKYTRRGLTFFLLDPHATRTSGRMPDLNLDPLAAADLAAYLQANSAANAVQETYEEDLLVHRDDDVATIAAGRRWFEQLRCINCHEVHADLVAQPATTLREMAARRDRGCLVSSESSPANYSLNETQRASLVASLANMSSGRNQRMIEPADEVRFRLAQLNCYGCHERDRLGGVGIRRRMHFTTVGDVDLGDEGRFPPALDRTGAKLQSDWIHQVLDGRGAVRPYLNIRMPRFPKDPIASLVEHWQQADAVAVTGPAIRGVNTQPDDHASERARSESVEAGRQLLDTGCVQCHPVRGERVAGAVGIDLQQVDRRLRPDWFQRFIRDPESQKAGTRMPSFFPQGVSQRPDLLGGDVDRQLTAIWNYLNTSEAPLPAKIEQARAASFEVTPTDRPIVMRTFMQEAGTHAIVVGFPAGVHFAMDAQQPRLATLWRGRFLDAYGTWFVRFAPPATPLGHDIQQLATVDQFRLTPPPLSTNETEGTVDAARDGRNDAPRPNMEAEVTFAGYRLDRDGVPTFLYRSVVGQIEDRLEPAEHGALQRTLRWRPRAIDATNATNATKDVRPSAGAWCRIHSGVSLERIDDRSRQNERGLRVEVLDGPLDRARIIAQEGHEDWWLPMNGTTSRIELRYSW